MKHTLNKMKKTIYKKELYSHGKILYRVIRQDSIVLNKCSSSPDTT